MKAAKRVFSKVSPSLKFLPPTPGPQLYHWRLPWPPPLFAVQKQRYHIRKSWVVKAGWGLTGAYGGLWLHCLGRNLLAPGVKNWCPGEGWGDTPRRHRSCAEPCLGHRKLEGNCTDG